MTEVEEEKQSGLGASMMAINRSKVGSNRPLIIFPSIAHKRLPLKIQRITMQLSMHINTVL